MTIKGECSVELIRENPDGSADYTFNFPKEALDALTRLGILTAIQAGIEDAKRLDPDQPVKQEWVGLTHHEVDSWELPDCPTMFEFVQFIESKLKEKNT